MRHIADAGGRFATVMPRSRQEDALFRKWIQTNSPAWELVWDRPNAREADGPRDLWYVYKPELPSAELYGIVWVWSTLLSLNQTHRRQKHLAAATEQLTGLNRRLASARARLRGATQIDLQVAQILRALQRGPLPDCIARGARGAHLPAGSPRPTGSDLSTKSMCGM